GHEIVEMGLVKLYRITGEKKYLNLAKFFIDSRGKVRDPNKAYSQDHKPVIEQTQAVGHAVRAGYLYSGVADVAALTGDTAYLKSIDKIWHNMVSKKFYITGGVGARHAGEAFGDNYELPNLTAYNETCAAIANVYWNYRMFLLHGDSKYIDVLERSLYNGVISGVGLDGKTFFYPNPLECDLQYKFNQGNTLTRQPWFDCSCCPTNLCRFMPSVPGYIYAQSGDKLFVNLFIQSSSNINIDGNKVAVSQETDYPWQGNVKVSVSPEKENSFAVCLRIPDWTNNQPVPSDLYTFEKPVDNRLSIKVNGEPAAYSQEKGYAVITRDWKKGDVIDYSMPMDIRRVKANPQVKDDEGKVALERGPIVYCVEGADNQDVDKLKITENTQLTSTFKPELLGGVETISGTDDSGKDTFMAIPYYVWNNRGADKMKVWLPEK
ncbi:MAG TPA: beta-L-arabinofuranosidase domain-containing protein, partial [Sunxiuqinia sp.]|nr:beta-L-arabinofuranosidase domain-containing protein [Sunxiuqinia sp.]